MSEKCVEKSRLVARLGFEPRQTESESAVLPLHNQAKYNTIWIAIVVYHKAIYLSIKK